jgi:DNA-binding NarL/FixJ family response regulator
MTSVLLVEDHAIFAEALVHVLEGKDDLEVVKVVDSAEEALQAMPGLAVDLALIDVSLPKMNGIELVGLLRQDYPDMPCLMISGHLSIRFVSRSLQAGARGYAIKDSSAGIIEGIQRVLEGEIYVSKELRNLNFSQ